MSPPAPLRPEAEVSMATTRMSLWQRSEKRTKTTHSKWRLELLCLSGEGCYLSEVGQISRQVELGGVETARAPPLHVLVHHYWHVTHTLTPQTLKSTSSSYPLVLIRTLHFVAFYFKAFAVLIYKMLLIYKLNLCLASNLDLTQLWPIFNLLCTNTSK